MKLSDRDRMQIVAMKASGSTTTAIAEHFRCTRKSVTRAWKRDVAAGSSLLYSLEVHERLRRQSLAAIANGLNCPDDPYRRALLALNFLKLAYDSQAGTLWEKANEIAGTHGR